MVGTGPPFDPGGAPRHPNGSLRVHFWPMGKLSSSASRKNPIQDRSRGRGVGFLMDFGWFCVSFSVQKSCMNEKGDRQDSIGKTNIKSIVGPPELHIECIKNRVFSCVLSAVTFSHILAQSGAQIIDFRRALPPSGVQFISRATIPWPVGSTLWDARACFLGRLLDDRKYMGRPCPHQHQPRGPSVGFGLILGDFGVQNQRRDPSLGVLMDF